MHKIKTSLDISPGCGLLSDLDAVPGTAKVHVISVKILGLGASGLRCTLHDDINIGNHHVGYQGQRWSGDNAGLTDGARRLIQAGQSTSSSPRLHSTIVPNLACSNASKIDDAEVGM